MTWRHSNNTHWFNPHHGLNLINHKALIIALLCALFQGMIMAGAHFVRTGEPSLPLDDSYIHLQYGKQIAQGFYFQYQQGDSVSGGATSFLYVHLIALGHLIGFDGIHLLYWLYALAFFCVTGIFYRFIQIGQRYHLFFSTGLIALALSSGYMGWAYWSGMEIALLTFLILSVYETLLRDDTFTLSLWIWLSLLTLCRPEGSIIAITLIALLSVKKYLQSDWKNFTFSWRNLIPPSIFTIALFGPNLFYYLAMGRTSGNGLIAKSLLYHPLMTNQEKMTSFFTNLVAIFQYLNGFFDLPSAPGKFIPPGLLLFAILGVIFIAWQGNSHRRWLCAALISPLIFCIPAVATLEVWSLHSYRYLIPFLPLLWILALFGIESIFRFIQRHNNPAQTMAIVILAALMQTAYLPSWSYRYSSQCATIQKKQIQATEWLNIHQPNDHIAINDAGALTFFGNYPIYDLVGLVTNTTTIPYRMGEGGLYEEIESLPREKRPQWAAVFPSWFEEMTKTYDIMHKPMVQFPDPFDQSFEKTIYQVNWMYAGMADTPRDTTMKQDWVLKDHLDIANHGDEKQHHYSFQWREQKSPDVAIPFRRNFGYHEEIDQKWPDIVNEQRDLIPRLKEEGILNQYDIVDSGRRITAQEQFIFNNINPQKPLHLILRTCDNSGRHPRFSYCIRVYVDDIFVDDWIIEGTAWNWYESIFTIPAKYIKHASVTLKLTNVGTPNYSYYDAYFYWACQSNYAKTNTETQI